MRLAISLFNFRPGRIGGAETFLGRLIASLPALANGDEIVLATYRDNADAIDTPGVRQVVFDRSTRQITAARTAEAFSPYRDRAAEGFLAQLGADAILFPQQSMYPKYAAGPSVLAVMDLQHLFFPQYFSAADRAFRGAIYPHSLRQAEHVIAISEFTRRTLLERYRLPTEKVTAVPLGFDPHRLTTTAAAPNVPRPYLYYPAATFPHKNHRGLFDTISVLKQRGQFDFRLVLSGMQTKHWDKLRRHAERLGLGETVVHVGFVSYDEVCGLYRDAEAVLFPTQFEGFGLPVLEAVGWDKKVIVSRLEVFEEVGVPERFRIDFAEPDQLHAALQLPGPTVLEKPAWTWTDCARETLRVMRETAAKRS